MDAWGDCYLLFSAGNLDLILSLWQQIRNMNSGPVSSLQTGKLLCVWYIIEHNLQITHAKSSSFGTSFVFSLKLLKLLFFVVCLNTTDEDLPGDTIKNSDSLSFIHFILLPFATRWNLQCLLVSPQDTFPKLEQLVVWLHDTFIIKTSRIFIKKTRMLYR